MVEMIKLFNRKNFFTILKSQVWPNPAFTHLILVKIDFSCIYVHVKYLHFSFQSVTLAFTVTDRLHERHMNVGKRYISVS